MAETRLFFSRELEFVGLLLGGQHDLLLPGVCVALGVLKDSLGLLCRASDRVSNPLPRDDPGEKEAQTSGENDD